MGVMLRYLLVSLFSYLPYLSCDCDTRSPEAQIVIIEDFITPEMANTLIEFHDGEKNDLNKYSDNEVTFSESTNPRIRHLVSEIASEILKVMKQSYPLSRKYKVDHCALYTRIQGNSCSYHADNIAFSCPIHGQDQGRLRTTCTGECPEAKFVPNHTPWREYSALLYLNDNFEGGEIVFEDGPVNKLYKRVIPIKKNMLVITPNGSNFYHEVFTIQSGMRYSLHFWFTSDPQHSNSIIQGLY